MVQSLGREPKIEELVLELPEAPASDPEEDEAVELLESPLESLPLEHQLQ